MNNAKIDDECHLYFVDVARDPSGLDLAKGEQPVSWAVAVEQASNLAGDGRPAVIWRAGIGGDEDQPVALVWGGLVYKSPNSE